MHTITIPAVICKGNYRCPTTVFPALTTSLFIGILNAVPQDPLHLLCIEPRFPGRLGAVADWLVRRRGYRCQFYHHSADPQSSWPSSVGNGLELVPFNVGGVGREDSVAWTRYLERGICYAYGCWEILTARRPNPVDLVLGRSAGLGSTLFFPAFSRGIPVVNLFDYYYHPHAFDLTGEMPKDISADYFHWRRAANAMDLLDLENGTTAWAPTNWQRDLYPAEYRHDFTVLHDGVDTRRFARRADVPRVIAGRSISRETRVVTFVARRTDRVRGFDRFLALANRLADLSNVLFVVAGGAIAERGFDIEFFGKNYQQHVLAKTPPHDPNQFWFLENVSQTTIAEILAASDLHVYPSRPYPVSRSLIEAMAAGCVVLAWDTDAIREFITHSQTGLLAPSHDLDAAVKLARAALDDPTGYRPLGDAAATLVRNQYAQDVTLPKLAEFFNQLARSNR